MLDLVRRWLRSRQGRLVLVGATGAATLLVSAVAAAQVPPAASPAPAPAATEAPAAVEPAPVAAPSPAAPAADPPAAQPPAAHAVPAAHQPAPPMGAHAPVSPHATGHGVPGGEHDAPGAHGKGYHHPEPFNFADLARYQEEKARAERGEKAHGEPLVPTTPYLYLLVNFAILAFIYYRAGKKPIADGLKDRHDTIAKDLIEAAKIKEEAEARLADYTKRLEQLEGELQRIKGEIIATGEADKERMVKEAEEKAERMRKDAQFLLDQEMKQLRLDMIAFTADAAVAAAETVLKSRVTSQDHDRLADDYLKQVSSAKSASSAGGAS